MPTRYFDIIGKVNWARVHEPDTKFNEMGEFNLDFYPRNWEDYERLGLERTPKTDSEGQRYVRLKRDNKKLIKGELREFGPPKVSIKDGKLGWVPFTGKIGNGSTVILNISVFDTRKAPGHRIEGISILELVEYNPDNASPASSSVPAGQDSLNDDIPF